MRLAAPLAACLLTACATGAANRYYDVSVANGSPAQAPVADESDRESVNGRLPQAVFIKTATQTLCRGYQFSLVDGRIYFKRTDAAPGELWLPLTETGLPHGTARGFRNARRVVSIAADADELYAISDEGVVYLLFVERARKQKPFRWIDRHGWPDVSPLVLNDLVVPHRAWSVGTRDAGVLWYEDAAGNPHHYGTMGIATLYFLSANGQEIRFADTGLPSDFSHSLLGPERGAFVSVGLSASASTIFLIGDAGEMYTRLADFDTLGSDPMFFKYTYRPKRSELPGSDYRTNFIPWALPSEPWRRQPPIPLSGAGAISRHVTILQTGRGNAARELRVAGLSPEGAPGYYHKAIFDAEWRFTPAPLTIDPADLLAREAVARGRGARGPRLDRALAGSLWNDGKKEPDLAFSIPDFSIREGSSTLRVSSGGESVDLALHTVDMWTYVKRRDPGFDGTPKLLHATVVIPTGALDGVSAGLRDRVNKIFGPLDGALFALKAEATERYVLIESSAGRVDLSGPLGLPGLLNMSGLVGRRDRFGLPGRPQLLLTSPGSADVDVSVLRNLSVGSSKQFDRYLSDDLVLEGSLTADRRGELDTLVRRNERFREELETERKLFRSYGRSAALTRWSYSIFDVLTTFTLLDRIDFPKLKTVTSHGDDIVRANARAYGRMASTNERAYEKLIDLLDLRISAYRQALGELEGGAPRASLPSGYRETWAEYLELVGIPPLLLGTSPARGGRTASVHGLADTPLFPGLVLAIDSRGTGPAEAEAETIAIVVLDDVAKAVLARSGGDPAAAPFRVKGRLQGALPRGKGETEPLDDDRAIVEWDGTTLTVWRDRCFRSKERIFVGRAVTPSRSPSP
jgi:hypothetical protein